MFNREMIGSHFGLKEISLLNHSIDVDVHDLLHEFFVIKSPVARVFVVDGFHLVLFEDTSKLIEASLEVLKISLLLIMEIKVGKSLFASFPFISLTVTF